MTPLKKILIVMIASIVILQQTACSCMVADIIGEAGGSDQKEQTSVTVSESKMTPRNSNLWDIYVKIKNVSDHDIYRVKLEFTCYDKNNEVSETFTEYVFDIEEGDFKELEITTMLAGDTESVELTSISEEASPFE